MTKLRQWHDVHKYIRLRGYVGLLFLGRFRRGLSPKHTLDTRSFVRSSLYARLLEAHREPLM